MRRALQWKNSIARRPWRADERRIVWRGFWGRLLIAVEPLAIALFFAALTVTMLVRHLEGALMIAPIFGVATILFLAYAVVLMVPPARAVIESFGSIWIVDGYVRYRSVEARRHDTAYYVAVLDHDRNELGEWPLDRRPPALDATYRWAALVEFTPYGGILRIDGRSTGVLPDDIPAFGVGAPFAYPAAPSDAPPRGEEDPEEELR